MAVPSQYSPYVASASKQYGVPSQILTGVISQESSWRNSPSTGNGGGLGQFIPSTWTGLGGGNIYDPQTNINHTAKYLSQLHQQLGSWPLAIGAYYAGAGSVKTHKSNLNYIPNPKRNSLTVQEYINQVLGTGASTASYSTTGFNWGLGTISNLGNSIVSPLVRFGFVVIGVVLVIIGGYMMLSDRGKKVAVDVAKTTMGGE